MLGENEYALQTAQPVLDQTEQGDQQRIRALIAMDRAYIQMGQPDKARELMAQEKQDSPPPTTQPTNQDKVP